MVKASAAVAGLVALAGCSSGPSRSTEAMISRAELVTTCADGTHVGRDPVTKRLVWTHWAGGRGAMAPEATIERACS